MSPVAYAFRSLALGALVLVPVLVSVLAPATSGQQATPLVQAHTEPSTGILWHTAPSEQGLTLRVSGPDGFAHQAEYSPGATPFIPLLNSAGQRLPEGVYTYEFVERVQFAPQWRTALSVAREAGDEMLVNALLADAGSLPDAPSSRAPFACRTA